MGRKSFAVMDLIELFAQWEAGRSQVQISESLGWDRKTIRKYLAPAIAEGLVPGGPPAGEAVWARRITAWFPGLSDDRSRKGTWQAIEVHRTYIEEQLKAGTAVSAISSRLTEKGLMVSRSSLRRWIAANVPKEAVPRRRAAPPRRPPE